LQWLEDKLDRTKNNEAIDLFDDEVTTRATPFERKQKVRP